MAEDVVMPRLSDSMEEGTILKWMKSKGDEVSVGDELVEIETDKANMVYEADTAGTLIEIIADENDTLPIGEVIARIGDESEADAVGNEGGDDGKDEDEAEAKADEGDEEAGAESDGEAESGDEGESAAESDDEEAQAADDAGGDSDSDGAESATATAEEETGAEEGDDAERDSNGRVKASPLAKRIASEKGLDLSSLKGSGPGGRIVKADVESAEAGDGGAPEEPEKGKAEPAKASKGEKPETARGDVEHEELTKLQRTVARRMAESKATAPHFYLTADIDMTRAVEARSRIKASAPEGGVVPSFNDMVIKACAIALREFPRANGAYRDGKLELYSRVNVGVAVAAQDALVVPTIFDADKKGLRQIAEDVRGLAGKVRDGKISPPELSGGTFTVSNLGMFGVDSFAAVINPPQAGILSVGAINEKPVVRDGEIVPGSIMSVTLACDHRILYGADGAEFLARVRALLEEPVSLAL